MAEDKRRTLTISAKIEEPEGYSMLTVAEAKVLAPYPLDLEQVYQSFAETLNQELKNVDKLYGPIERKVELTRVGDSAKIEAGSTDLDDLPF